MEFGLCTCNSNTCSSVRLCSHSVPSKSSCPPACMWVLFIDCQSVRAPSSLAWPDLTGSVYCYNAIPGCQCDPTVAGKWKSSQAFCFFRNLWVHLDQKYTVLEIWDPSGPQLKSRDLIDEPLCLTCGHSPRSHLLNLSSLTHLVVDKIVRKKESDRSRSDLDPLQMKWNIMKRKANLDCQWP